MSHEENKAAVKLHAVGVDERSRNALQLFLQQNRKLQCIMVEESLADIFLVDMDGYEAKPRYEALRGRYPNHPMILMSLFPQKTADQYFVQKPIRINQLQSILDKIQPVRRPTANQAGVVPSEKPAQRPEVTEPTCQRPTGHAAQLLSEQEILSFVGSSADINVNDPEQLAGIYFDPANSLLGRLQQAWRQALEQQRVLRISGLWQPITLFPATGEVHVNLSDRQLQSICVVAVDAGSGGIRIADVKIEAVDGAVYTSLVEQGQLQDMELFLWKVALWTSRGRIPTGVELDRPVYLRAWPNFTRLIVTPHALRISACLTKQPRSLIDLATVLQIPQRYVFSFFTAVNMLDLAGQARRSSDVIVEPSKVRRSSRSGLLSRILKSLVR